MLDAFFTKRTIRHFKDKSIAPQDLLALFRAGMHSTQNKKNKPWQFIIVNNSEIMNKIHEIFPFSEILENAPACIVICGDKSLESADDFALEDCNTSINNILLVAQCLNIGTCFLGIRPREVNAEIKYQKLFSLPHNIVSYGFIVLGYVEPYANSAIPFNSRPHFNHW